MQYVDGKHPVRVAIAKQRVTVPSHDLVATSPKQKRAWETHYIPDLLYVCVDSLQTYELAMDGDAMPCATLALATYAIPRGVLFTLSPLHWPGPIVRFHAASYT